jgi:hypothetical protein
LWGVTGNDQRADVGKLPLLPPFRIIEQGVIHVRLEPVLEEYARVGLSYIRESLWPILAARPDVICEVVLRDIVDRENNARGEIRAGLHLRVGCYAGIVEAIPRESGRKNRPFVCGQQAVNEPGHLLATFHLL